MDGTYYGKEGSKQLMSRFHRPLYITLLLILGFWLAGQEFVRAGQTSVLPVIELPAELPPRTSPTEADPELQAFLSRAQRVSWAFGGIFGYGSALQIQDAAGRVNGRDSRGRYRRQSRTAHMSFIMILRDLPARCRMANLIPSWPGARNPRWC